MPFKSNIPRGINRSENYLDEADADSQLDNRSNPTHHTDETKKTLVDGPALCDYQHNNVCIHTPVIFVRNMKDGTSCKDRGFEEITKFSDCEKAFEKVPKHPLRQRTDSDSDFYVS